MVIISVKKLFIKLRKLTVKDINNYKNHNAQVYRNRTQQDTEVRYYLSGIVIIVV